MKNGLSARQLAVASFTGLLSPAAAVAGLDWRGALLALPVVMAAAWCWGRLGDWTARMKGWPGKLLSFIYMVWAAALAGGVLAAAGARVTAPEGRGVEWVVLLLWLPVLCLTRMKPAAFGRAAEIFYLAMGAALAFVLLFGAAQVKFGRLLEPSGMFWESFLTAAGVGCGGVAALLLWDGGTEGERTRWTAWSTATAVALLLMSAVTTGTLTPGLAAAQERPFFIMTVGLGETARVEGLVSALWLLADVTLLGLLLQCCRRMWMAMLSGRTRGGVWIPALAVLGLGVWLAAVEQSGSVLKGILPLWGLVMGGVLPFLGLLVAKCRKTAEGGYI